MLACKMGNKNIVEYLIGKFPWLMKQKDPFGCTGFYYACHGGHVDIIDFLPR